MRPIRLADRRMKLNEERDTHCKTGLGFFGALEKSNLRNREGMEPERSFEKNRKHPKDAKARTHRPDQLNRKPSNERCEKQKKKNG